MRAARPIVSSERLPEAPSSGHSSNCRPRVVVERLEAALLGGPDGPKRDQ
jgi:hypothetical protein